MMTGLPEDSPEGSIKTAEQLIALNPDFVRIYPTLVFRGTRLFDLWKSGAYQPQTTDEAVSLCAALYERFFAAGIPVIRIGLPENKEAASGPQHASFGELVESECYKTVSFGCFLLIRTKNRIFSWQNGSFPKRLEINAEI